MFSSYALLAISFSFLLYERACAGVVEYDWDIAWVWTAPDGHVSRPVIGINGEWPLPTIEATVGDTIIVNAHNSLGNQSTSIHFHGLFMNGTSHMDGTSFVSQCAISPGTSFTYKFTAQQSGTYWYHSHQKAQYPDGLRGMLVIRDDLDPYIAEYDEELIISLSDWYHGQMPDLVKDFDLPENKMRDPTPDRNLINDSTESKLSVLSEKTYLVRIANIGAFVGQYFWIQNHGITVIEVDGVQTQPQEAGMLYIAAGQRYSFLLKTKAKEDATKNFPIISRMDTGSFSKHVPWPSDLDARAWLQYDEKAAFPPSDPLEAAESTFALDDMVLIPLDEEPLLEPVDRTIPLNIDMKDQEDGIVHWMFNTVRYQTPRLPSLFSALAGGPDATDPKIFDQSTQTFVLECGEVVEITMINKHMWKHPVHLHGHNFQITNRTKGMIDGTPAGQAPMRRDTVVVNSHGQLSFRFRADNPGVWLFHCHMEWHAHSGLKATFVEAPLQLQQQLRLDGIEPKLNPEEVCSTAHVQSLSSEPIEEARWFGLDTTIFLLITLAAAFTIGGGCTILWYRRRASTQGTYAPVPLGDVDESQKEQHLGHT